MSAKREPFEWAHPMSTGREKTPNQPFSSIAAERHLQLQPSDLGGQGDPPRRCEDAPSTTSDVGVKSVCVHDDSVAVLDTGATANLTCFKWLGNHVSRLQKMGTPKASTYPTFARLKFGDGRVEEVRCAADF